MRRFSENACLVGGAVLIWLSILGAIATAAVGIYAVSSTDDGDEKPTFRIGSYVCVEQDNPPTLPTGRPCGRILMPRGTR
jgi:hypothetical protein